MVRPLQAAAITYRIAFGPRAGEMVLTLRGAIPREGWTRQALCADIDAFNLGRSRQTSDDLAICKHSADIAGF